MSGDQEAFGILFARHQERLWAVAIRTLADPEEAADALQDAMISAFRRAGSFRGDAAVTTWLHRIVVNACLDRLRRRAARPASTGLDEGTLDALARPAGGPADRDTALDVTAALRTLPAEQRSALVLVDMLGYPVAEAADLLGISVGTVKSRCARGRARLLPKLAHLRGLPPGTAPAAGIVTAGPVAQSPAGHAQPRRGTPGTQGSTLGPPGGPPPLAGNQLAAGDVSPARGGGENQP